MKQNSIDRKERTGKLLFETGFLIMVINVIVGFEIYQAIVHHWRVALGGELFFQAFIRSTDRIALTYLNQKSIYIYVLSILFSFLGNKEEIVLIFNLILKLAGIGFFYLGIRKMGSYIYPFILAVTGAILSIVFYPVIADTSMHMVWFLTGFLFFVCTKLYYDMSGNKIKWMLSGICVGFFCYVDFLGTAVWGILICFLFFSKKNRLKDNIKPFLTYFFASILSFGCTFVLWNQYRWNRMLFLQWFWDKMEYFNSSEPLKQYICIAIMLGCCLLFFILSERNRDKEVKKSEMLVTMVPNQPLEEKQESIIIQKKKEEDKPKEETEAEEEKKNKVKLIKNPLPLPKKHVKKELNYAFDPSSDQMHYDLNNYRLDDDYDLKEL